MEDRGGGVGGDGSDGSYLAGAFAHLNSNNDEDEESDENVGVNKSLHSIFSQSSSSRSIGWSHVEVSVGSVAPCQRSLHTGAVLGDCLYIFGGYDGQSRINDFHGFHFHDKRWFRIIEAGAAITTTNSNHQSSSLPSPRDRHVSVVHENSFYVFGGFDGTTRVNDFYKFDFGTMRWSIVVHSNGAHNDHDSFAPPPSPRHSHAAVVYNSSMYVFGGYDGSYRSDFHQFNFLVGSWVPLSPSGRPPKARYRATAVVHQTSNSMLLFGGHDGTRHLNDTHIFEFLTNTWSTLQTNGPLPIARDSHISVIHHDTLYVFGGSTGTAMNDLHQLSLHISSSTDNVNNTSNHVSSATWSPVVTKWLPDHRFCHVANVYNSAMYVFGGYDGSNRLNDFIRYQFDVGVDDLTSGDDVSPSTLLSELRSFIDNETMADVTIYVENDSTPMYAHKLLLTRCSYFRAMLITNTMKEATQDTITLPEIRRPIFKSVLEYLYTDTLDIKLEHAMELFIAADQFCIPRLKAMCEKKMLESITVETAANLFYVADCHSADSLKAKTLRFILAHFESVCKTAAFEEMARGNVELVFEILRSR